MHISLQLQEGENHMTSAAVGVTHLLAAHHISMLYTSLFEA